MVQRVSEAIIKKALMEKRFSPHSLASIDEAERLAYRLYKDALEPYAVKYASYGVSLKIAIEWKSRGLQMKTRPEIDSTYEAFIVCRGFDSSGHIVESSDHDFCMDFAWFLSIYDGGEIVVFEDIDGEMHELLQTCDDYFAHPY